MAFHPLSAKSWLLTIYMGNRSDKGLDKWQANLVTTSSVLLSISPKLSKARQPFQCRINIVHQDTKLTLFSVRNKMNEQTYVKTRSKRYLDVMYELRPYKISSF